jgi:hypothetical protein
LFDTVPGFGEAVNASLKPNSGGEAGAFFAKYGIEVCEPVRSYEFEMGVTEQA